MFTFSPMLPADATEVCALFHGNKDLKFADWETRELLQKMLEKFTAQSFLARCSTTRRLAAAALCGSVFERSTLSHVFVAPDFQRHGIGTRMTNLALAAFKARGNQVAHALCVVDNHDGRRFWSCRMKFVEPTELNVLEYDFPQNLVMPDDILTLNCDNMAMVEGLIISLCPSSAKFVGSMLKDGEKRSACLLTYDKGEVSGFAMVGLYGVRGAIHRIRTKVGFEWQAQKLLKAAGAWLVERGLLRAHSFTMPNEPEWDILTKGGFTNITPELFQIGLAKWQEAAA